MITGKGSFWKYKLDHILFWLFTVLFHAYIRRFIIDKAGWGQFALEIIIRNGLLAVIVYANLLIVLPLLKIACFTLLVLLNNKPLVAIW